jgi:opacity protein-like surface antigen
MTRRFAFVFGLQGGITYFTEATPFGTDMGIGKALVPGYNLALRASIEFFPWLAFDLRGRLMNDLGNAAVQFGSLTTLGVMGAARLTLPLPHVSPYVLLGFGDYHLSASGAQTLLVSDSDTAFEVGLGAIIPTGRGFEVGVEYSYSHLNGETLSTNMNADGGDPSTLDIFVQYRLPL